MLRMPFGQTFLRSIACLILCSASARADTAPVCPVLALDGVDAYAIGDSVYPGGTLASFTAEAWFYPIAGGLGLIVGDDAYDLTFFLNNDEPTIEWRISTGEPFFSGTPIIFGSVTGFGLGLFKWNHVALTFNAAMKQLMVFVNGVTGVSTTLMISNVRILLGITS